MENNTSNSESKKIEAIIDRISKELENPSLDNAFRKFKKREILEDHIYNIIDGSSYEVISSYNFEEICSLDQIDFQNSQELIFYKDAGIDINGYIYKPIIGKNIDVLNKKIFQIANQIIQEFGVELINFKINSLKNHEVLKE